MTKYHSQFSPVSSCIKWLALSVRRQNASLSVDQPVRQSENHVPSVFFVRTSLISYWTAPVIHLTPADNSGFTFSVSQCLHSEMGGVQR